MLADIAIFKAKLVGQYDFPYVLFIGLCGGGVGPETVGKYSEFHV